MIYGISGKPVPDAFPYAPYFNEYNTFPPLLIASIAWRETLSGMSPEAARTCISGDGGHGLMQLTSSFPDDWDNIEANIEYAVVNFLTPALDYWHGLQGLAGSDLILCVAATYNEGLGAAEHYHAEGDVDAGTTNQYGHGVLAIYNSLLTTGKPPS